MDVRVKKKFDRMCKESFVFFLAAAWKHLGLPHPTKRQVALAKRLQFGPKRDIIEAFRGIGKSWITSAFVCWRLLNDPQERILVVSASKERADSFSTFTLRLIKEMPILQHLTPRADQRESKICFDVAPSKNAHAPSVKSAGIFGQITGSRATLIIADDVEVANNSATDDLREKLMSAVSEFNAILVPEGEPRIIFLGTPQTEESIYNKLRTRGYSCFIIPARFPNQKQAEGYGGALAPQLVRELEKNPDLVGRPTDPARFHEDDLIEREGSYGRSGFLLQFMLDTSLSDAERYPLKHGDLVVMDLNKEVAPIRVQYGSAKEQQIKDLDNIGFAGDRWFGPMWVADKVAPYEGMVMAIDPSGRGSDHTGYAIVAQLHGLLFVLAAGGLPGGYDDPTLLKLATMAKLFKVKEIIIEANFGDGMFTKILSPVLQRVYPCTTTEVKHSIQKEKRIIDTLEPVMNGHRLVMSKDVVKADLKFLKENPEQNQRYSLFYQMTRITKERGALKHDDTLDALAIAVAYWIESMAREEGKAEAAYTERMLKQELENHIKHCVNNPFPNQGRPSNGGFLDRRFGGRQV